MQIFVINLDHREDRLKSTTEQLRDYEWSRFPAFNGLDKTLDELDNCGWFADREWIDPCTNTAINRGEVGCFVSHFMTWLTILQKNTPAIILEDDIRLLRNLDLEHIKNKVSDYDLVYLGYKEMRPEKAHDIDNELISPVYPYQASSYYLSVEGARKLVNTGIRKRIIPVDEYMPLMIGMVPDIDVLQSHYHFLENDAKLRCAAFKEHYFRQFPRTELGTDTVDTQSNFYSQTIKTNKPVRMHFITIATNREKAHLLYDSAIRFQCMPINIASGVTWQGGDMKRLPGGGHKINLIKNYLEKVDDDDYILYMDGYDTLFLSQMDDIKGRILGFGVDILFAAEKTCWPNPDWTDKFPTLEYGTEYKCPNDGLFAGRAGALKQFFFDSIDNEEDSHLYIAAKYLKNLETRALNVTVDSENYVFQCMSNVDKDELQYVEESNQIRNAKTRCRPGIIHGNGGIEAKELFGKFVRQNMFKNSDCPTCGNMLHLEPYKEGTAKKVGQEIYMIDFMNEYGCNKLISQAEDYGEWEPLYGDAYPGQEIRIEKFNPELFEQFKAYFDTHVKTFVNETWWPTPKAELRDAFIIKFEPGGQESLDCHNDASLVSGIVKLNNTYEGGETYWHRQHFSNRHQPVGSLILWPGQLTHGHEGKQVTKGTKYNLVFWTKRFGE